MDISSALCGALCGALYNSLTLKYESEIQTKQIC